MQDAEYAARFWAKVDRSDEDGCWLWLAHTAAGYGRFRLSNPRRIEGAHRVAYELLIGPIPEGLDIDHLCRNRSCVNPAHLEPVTRGENVRRGARGRLVTHCPQGHAYDEPNTYVDPQGLRHCRACRRARELDRYHRRKHDASTATRTEDAD